MDDPPLDPAPDPAPTGDFPAPPPSHPVVAGTLYVIATPIGNLEDFSPRARRILASVDIVACEDTRITSRLLSTPGAGRELVAYRDDNEQAVASRLAARLQAGASVALVGDAGTPAVSDPGFRLVRLCRARGIPVVPVPGPAACLAALSVSGLPSDSFLFVGFLPARSAARRRFFETHRDFPHTILFYESCHRIDKFLTEALEILGPDRAACIARELTKRFETIHAGPLGDIVPRALAGSTKGEFVVCLAPAGFRLDPGF